MIFTFPVIKNDKYVIDVALADYVKKQSGCFDQKQDAFLIESYRNDFSGNNPGILFVENTEFGLRQKPK